MIQSGVPEIPEAASGAPADSQEAFGPCLDSQKGPIGHIEIRGQPGNLAPASDSASFRPESLQFAGGESRKQDT